MLRNSISPKNKREKNNLITKINFSLRDGQNRTNNSRNHYFFQNKRGQEKPSEWTKSFMNGNFKSTIISPSQKDESSFFNTNKQIHDSVDYKSSHAKNFYIRDSVKVTPVIPTASKITPNPTDTTFDGSSIDNRTLASRNQTQRRTAFEDLITMFSGSSSKKPLKLFETTFTDTTSKTNLKEGFKVPLNDNSYIWDDLTQHLKSEEKKKVDIVSIIPTLIRSSKLNNIQMLIKDFHSDIPQISDFAWDAIVTKFKTNAIKRIEFIIVNMIKFSVESVFDIVLPDDKLLEKIEFCMKHNKLYPNEAKHILIYLHDNSTTKKLLISKYVFYIKSNHNFPKGLKDEKDVMLYYHMILGILDFRYKTEANPLCTSIPKLRELALEYVYKKRELQPYLNDWFKGRLSNGFFVEKLYIYPNPRGKDANLYEFNLKEYFSFRYTDKKNSVSPLRVSQLPSENDSRPQTTTLFRSESAKQLLTSKSQNFIKISQILTKQTQIVQVVPNKVDIEITAAQSPKVLQTSVKSSKSHNKLRYLSPQKKYQKQDDNYRTPSDVSMADYDTGATREVLDEKKIKPRKNYSRSTGRLRASNAPQDKIEFTNLNMRFNDIKMPTFESSITRTYTTGFSPMFY